MRVMILPMLLIGALAATSCRSPVKGKGSSDISAVGIFGGAVVNVAPVACSGRIGLNGGAAEAKDSCFTGVSPVRFAPGSGALAIGGSGNDVIAYARLR